MSATIDRLKDLTRPTGQEQLLDVAYPTPRWTLTLRQGMVAGALVLLIVGAWVVLQRDPEPAALPVADLPAVAAGPSADPGTDLVVSVVGHVAHPGLVTLAPGARVDDALAAAEPLPEADLLALNRAQRLTDGQQLVVPSVGEAAPPDAGSGGAGAVSLNSADVAELTTLDGVGEATASAIIAHREATGGFTAIDQLMDVKGIGPAKFEALRDQVSL